MTMEAAKYTVEEPPDLLYLQIVSSGCKLIHLSD